MSKISVSSPAAGTATYTISAPAGSTDRTITLPDASGTILTTATPGVPVNGPAFSATISTGQSISNVTNTKLNFTAEVFDTNSAYDAGNSRFLPLIAGYYQINVLVTFDSGVSATINSASVFKNGSAVAQAWIPSTPQYCGVQVSAIVYLNGSTDYVEAYTYQNTGSAKTTLTGSNTNFSGALIRSAT